MGYYNSQHIHTAIDDAAPIALEKELNPVLFDRNTSEDLIFSTIGKRKVA
ncbi:hypothetical protein [Nitrosomonas sp. PY1]|nr:hypothetical protein [Nitrosomonas sp. PY1]